MLASAIEGLEDSPAKSILQSVFKFTFQKAPAAAAAEKVGVSIDQPGSPILGKDRNKGKFRGLFCFSTDAVAVAAPLSASPSAPVAVPAPPPAATDPAVASSFWRNRNWRFK